MNVEELKKFIAEALEEPAEEEKKIELELEIKDDKIEVEANVDNVEFEGELKPEGTLEEAPAEEEKEPALEESVNEETEKAFYVTYKVEGRYTVRLHDVKDADEAIAAADGLITETDFGELEDIDSEPIYVENEKGDFVWEA